MRSRTIFTTLIVVSVFLASACSRTPALPKVDPAAPRSTDQLAKSDAAATTPASADGKSWWYTSLFFKDDQTGMVAALRGSFGAKGLADAETGLWRTTDGGKNWAKVGAPGFAVSRFRFTDDTHGLAVGTSFTCQAQGGECKVFIADTADGGKSWTTRFSANLPGGAGDNQPVLSFTDANHGFLLFAGMTDRFLLMTSDGGQHWNPVGSLPDGFQPDGASFIDTKRGWALGRSCQSTPGGDCTYAVFVTADGGGQWARQFQLPDGRRLRAGTITFVDANRGWLFPTSDTAYCSMGGCAGPLYRTDDGGKTWVDVKWKESKHTEQGMVGFPRTVEFVGPSRGWMLVESGASSGVGGIGVSADGGVTWDRYAPTGVHTFSLLDPTTDSVAWAVGGPAGDPSLLRLMRTTDGAKTWTPVTAPFAAGAAKGN